MLHPLEASDAFGLEGLPDRERLLAWLDSWLQDPDAMTCQLEKLEGFTADPFCEHERSESEQ